jgi:hypothetical protein
MNKNDIVKAMLKGNEPRMLMGHIANVKTEINERLMTPDSYPTFDKITGEIRRADFKVTLEFVFFTENDEQIKEVRNFLEDVNYEKNKMHTKSSFILMRSE